MKKHRAILILVAVAALIAPAALATGNTDSASHEEARVKTQAESPAQGKHFYRTANFTVPELDDALIKKVVGALSKQEGVLRAKPDMKAKVLAVTFDSKKIAARKLEELVREVAPEAKIKEVVMADASTLKGCGACPSKSKCSKAKMEAAEKPMAAKKAEEPGEAEQSEKPVAVEEIEKPEAK